MTKEATILTTPKDSSKKTVDRTEQHIEIAKNNAATNAGKRFFHLGEQEKFSTSSFRLLGERSIVSNELYSRIQTQFDWYSLPSFTSHQIKEAAKAALLTVYDSANKPPYLEITLEKDEYMLVLFGTEKKIPVKLNTWGEIAKALSGVMCPPLEYEYSAVRFVDTLVATPRIGFTVSESDRTCIAFPIQSFENTIEVNKKSAQVNTLLLSQLRYEVPTLALGELVSLLPLEELTEKEHAHYNYLRDNISLPEQGIYFLDSEIDPRKKS